MGDRPTLPGAGSHLRRLEDEENWQQTFPSAKLAEKYPRDTEETAAPTQGKCHYSIDLAGCPLTM